MKIPTGDTKDLQEEIKEETKEINKEMELKSTDSIKD